MLLKPLSCFLAALFVALQALPAIADAILLRCQLKDLSPDPRYKDLYSPTRAVSNEEIITALLDSGLYPVISVQNAKNWRLNTEARTLPSPDAVLFNFKGIWIGDEEISGSVRHSDDLPRFSVRVDRAFGKLTVTKEPTAKQLLEWRKRFDVSLSGVWLETYECTRASKAF